MWVIRLGDSLRAGTTEAGGCAKPQSESGHNRGWRLCVAAVANCEAADHFVNSASPHAAAPRSLTDLHQKPCKPGHVHRARSEVGTPGAGSPPSVPSWARGGIRARSVRYCGVPQEQRRTEGRHGRGGRLRIAAPANYRAASRLAGSTTTRAASRGRCAAPPHERPVTCTGRAARWARRARGRGRLCRPVPTSLAAVLCPLACITRRQPPQVPLQL